MFLFLLTLTVNLISKQWEKVEDVLNQYIPMFYRSYSNVFLYVAFLFYLYHQKIHILKKKISYCKVINTSKVQ